jgi:hypothetical protein
MLEAEIKKLTAAVEALTAQLAATQQDAPSAPPADNAKTEQKAAPKVEKKKPDGPSIDELQEQAMAKVREDRKKKTAIKDLIASYGGAKIIAEIPSEDLPEFAEKLGAI